MRTPSLVSIACIYIFAAFTALVSFFTGTAQALTPADVVGPDGIVYPDWKWAGVQGGIPTSLPIRASIPSGTTDLALAIEQGAALAASQGGGVVTIAAGSYDLNRPVLIPQDNVVIRGAGASATIINFTYIPSGSRQIKFFHPTTSTTMDNNDWVEIHADPAFLTSLKLKWGSVVISTSGSSPGIVVASAQGCINATGGPGTKTLTAEAAYSNGLGTLTTNITVTFTNGAPAYLARMPIELGAITFYGIGDSGTKINLAANGVRGDTTLTLVPGHGIVAGDKIKLVAPSTAAWNDLVDNGSPSSIDKFRAYMFQVTAVSGNVITLNQPLRLDYPLSDVSFVEKYIALSGGGVENLTIDQGGSSFGVHGVMFSDAWNCWMKGVTVKKTGHCPAYFIATKWCEVRDCIFDGQWTPTAYVGFERSYDCLLDNVTTYALRHAPLVQYSAAGNVFRNSAFYDSDAQWHAGWANENLFENCVVESNKGEGSYENGMYTPLPSSEHGPIGPRNVVYNSDVTSPLLSVALNGQNKGWIFRYNRFITDATQGIAVQWNSSDHIIRNNVFAMRRGTQGIWLKDADCSGLQVIDNTFYGIGTADIVGGATGAATMTGNTTIDCLTPLTFLNPGFENNLTSWSGTAISNGMATIATADPHSGSNCLRMTDSSTTVSGNLSCTTIPVQGGKGYMARFWAKTLAGTAAAAVRLNIIYYNSLNQNIGSAYGINVPLNAFWGKYSLYQLAPQSAVRATLQLVTGTAETVTMDIDDFEFGSIPYEIANGGFESGSLAPWDNTGDNGMSVVSTSAKYGGGWGVRITDTSSTLKSSLKTDPYPVTVGNTYQVRYFERFNSGSGMKVSLEFFNSGGTSISQIEQDVTPGSTVAWRQQVIQATAPPGAATVKFNLYSTAAAIVNADFDEFIFSEAPPRPATTVPSIFDNQRVGINRTLNKTVTASSYNSQNWVPANINNGGTPGSGWASDANQGPVAWVKIDMGQTYALNYFAFQADASAGNRNCKDYVLYGSSTGAFTGEEFVISSGQIPSLALSQIHKVYFPTASARYLKFKGTSSWGPTAMIVVGELSVFGP